jgi:hypothetical protein
MQGILISTLCLFEITLLFDPPELEGPAEVDYSSVLAQQFLEGIPDNYLKVENHGLTFFAPTIISILLLSYSLSANELLQFLNLKPGIVIICNFLC